MATAPGLIALTTAGAAEDSVAAALAAALADGRARRFRPAQGPPGEYPDDDSGELRGVWIVEQPTAEERNAVGSGNAVEAYAVDSLVQWDEPDDDPANGEVSAMRLAFIIARSDLTHDDFVQRWREHAPVAKKHQPDFRRYVQHVVSELLTPSCRPYAAIGEFGFRRLAQGEGIRRFDSPEGQVVVEADIARFLERSGARSIWIRPA